MWVAGGSVLAVAGTQRSVDLEQLFLDPAFLSGQPWYTGVLSDLGVLGWATATVTALWGGWVAAQTGRPSAARFLRAAAAVSVVLLADDLLQLHADLLRFTGVPKAVRQLLIVLPAVAWMVRYAADIARTRWVILVGALAGFGLSLLVDGLTRPGSTVGLFVEDSAKLLGVMAWAQYLVLTSLDIMRSTIRDASLTSGPPVALARHGIGDDDTPEEPARWPAHDAAPVDPVRDPAGARPRSGPR
jgi:hypothetical protein